MRVAVRVAGLWKRIQRMGAVAPIPPQERSAAAPDGAPPRRIREAKTALAQRGPDEAPERLRAKARRVLLITDALNLPGELVLRLNPDVSMTYMKYYSQEVQVYVLVSPLNLGTYVTL